MVVTVNGTPVFRTNSKAAANKKADKLYKKSEVIYPQGNESFPQINTKTDVVCVWTEKQWKDHCNNFA